MNGNAELLNFVYQNSQMGIDTIGQLIDITEDNEFREFLKKQKADYEEFHEKARDMLNENGFDEKGISLFEKIRTYLMINFQTLTDKSTQHIAQMLIIGSNMGVTEAIQDLNKYKEAEKDIIKLMEKLKDYEEKNIEKLKEFL